MGGGSRNAKYDIAALTIKNLLCNEKITGILKGFRGLMKNVKVSEHFGSFERPELLKLCQMENSSNVL